MSSYIEGSGAYMRGKTNGSIYWDKLTCLSRSTSEFQTRERGHLESVVLIPFPKAVVDEKERPI